MNFKKDTETLKICQTCFDFEYDGAWHFEKPPFLKEKDPNENIYIQIKTCPACGARKFISQYYKNNF